MVQVALENEGEPEETEAGSGGLMLKHLLEAAACYQT